MTASSKPLLIRTDRPIDPLALQIIRLIDGILRGAGIPYMLVGATARDLLLHHVYGLPVTRATYDVDFAILVDSWEQFASVKQLFLKVPGFIDKRRDKQRLFYQQTPAAPATIIDIIPFGKLEASDRTIAWPPDAEVMMNVTAFSDVFKGALGIKLEPTLQIAIPSIAGLVILKLFAWLDRHDGRDVQDFKRLLETYTDAGNEDRLYEEETVELERVDFDTVLAGAFLLGKDARQITDQTIRDQLGTALSGKNVTALVDQIARSMSSFEDRTESSTALLKGFFRGIGLNHLL